MALLCGHSWTPLPRGSQYPFFVRGVELKLTHLPPGSDGIDRDTTIWRDPIDALSSQKYDELRVYWTSLYFVDNTNLYELCEDE